MGMLFQLFISKILTSVALSGDAATLIDGLKQQYNTICGSLTNNKPKFKLEPLLFTPKPAADTYYSLFDDFLAKSGEVCFDTTTGQPCAGSSQAANYLYDLKEALKTATLDERALNFYMRRFIWFLDQITSNDASTYPQSVLNIPKEYSRVLLDSAEVKCCFEKYINNTTMLPVFTEFLTIMKAEITTLMQQASNKLKKNALRDKQCVPLSYYYLCTLNETTDFFTALADCAKTAPATKGLTESKIICVNISSTGGADGPRINNYILVSTGPASAFALRSLGPQQTPAPVEPEPVKEIIVSEVEEEAPLGFSTNLDIECSEEQLGTSQYLPCVPGQTTDYSKSIADFNKSTAASTDPTKKIPLANVAKFCPCDTSIENPDVECFDVYRFGNACYDNDFCGPNYNCSYPRSDCDEEGYYNFGNC